MGDMNTRETAIAEAAIRAYSKRGVKRTSMSVIAQEAKVTRQTVYNAFPSTDAVLRAAIRLFIERKWQLIQSQWQVSNDLEEKIDILLQHFALEPWEYVHSSPEAAELERGYNAAGHAEIGLARDGFRDDIAALFVPFEAKLANLGTDPAAVSDFISFAIEGIKYNCQTRTEMLAGIATLKAALIALTKLP
jgi:AcrR family transcriptional regulator